MLLLMMFSGVQGFVTVPGLGLIVPGAAVEGGGVGLGVVATVMVTTGVVVVVVVVVVATYKAPGTQVWYDGI